MSASLTVFTYWLIVASWQMGVPTLPIAVDDDVAEWAWAATCYGCEPPQYEVTIPLLKYGDRTFLKYVAYHEVCHRALNHRANWDEGKKRSLNEFAANRCASVYMSVSMAEIARADATALAWDQEQKRER